jgi:hypothetical protein
MELPSTPATKRNREKAPRWRKKKMGRGPVERRALMALPAK